MRIRQHSSDRGAFPRRTTSRAATATPPQLPVDIAAADFPRLAKAWILHGDITGHSRNTLLTRESRIKCIEEYLTSTGAERLNADTIKGLLQYLRHGHEAPKAAPGSSSDSAPAPVPGRWAKGRGTLGKGMQAAKSSTLKSYYATLRAFFNWLIQEDEISASPMSRIPAPIDRLDQIQPFSTPHIQALLAAVLHPKGTNRCGGKAASTQRRNEAIFYLLLDTGIRASELCNLRLEDVSLSALTIRILHGKGDKSRTVHFSPITRRALYDYIKEQKDMAEDDLLFFGFRGRTPGQGLTISGLYQIVIKWGRDADIKGVRVSPHTFRHTYAVRFLQNGGHVFALKQMLGHESLTIVNRYVSLAQSDIANQHAQYSPVSGIFGAGRNVDTRGRRRGR